MELPKTAIIEGNKIVLEVLTYHEGTPKGATLSHYLEADNRLVETKQFPSYEEGLKAFQDLKEYLEDIHNPT